MSASMRDRGVATSLAFGLGIALVMLPIAARGSQASGAAGVSPHRPPGTALTHFDAPATATAIALERDGKIVAGGAVGHGRSHWAMVRFLRNGKLDQGFRRVSSSPGADSRIDDIAIQPDGKIVAVGDTSRRVRRPDLDWLIGRYLPNGELDRTFGREGYVRTDFGGNDTATQVALQPNGKIVVAGLNTRANLPYRFAVARYRRDGRLDRSFGRHGKTTADFGGASLLEALRLKRSGEIAVAGISGTGTENNVALARFTRSGALDPAFGVGGRLLVSSLPPNADPELSRFSQPSMVFAGNGDLVTADDGVECEGACPGTIDTARFRPTGTRDPRYGSGGVSAIPGVRPGEVTGVAMGPDGSGIILQSGAGGKASGPALTRVTQSGELDRSFGRKGHARSVWGGANDLSQRLAIAPAGEIFVSGAYSRHLIGFKGIFAVTSFDRHGRLRRSFG
jgi:uncharacterized delta-60 repeat protein